MTGIYKVQRSTKSSVQVKSRFILGPQSNPILNFLMYWRKLRGSL